MTPEVEPKKLEFTVEGMTCASCAVNLENFLHKQTYNSRMKQNGHKISKTD